jgi:hypothetical protein
MENSLEVSQVKWYDPENLHLSTQKNENRLGEVAHSCNPSQLRGKKLVRPHLN